MRKFLISGVVVAAFFIYALSQRPTNITAEKLDYKTISIPTKPTATPKPSETITAAPTSPPTIAGGKYKDGNYTGSVVFAYYGNVQVGAAVQDGKIIDVTFLQYPNDRDRSLRISNIALPYLKQESIQAQSADVNIVSGATQTSEAYRESLAYALNQATK